MKVLIRLLILLPFFLHTLSAEKQSTDTHSWPQWRGPDRDGLIAKNAPWPEKIDSTSLKQSWRIEMGKGYSGPIVSDKFVFSTESIDEYELIRAYNRQDGKLVWQTQWEGKMKVPFLPPKMEAGFARLLFMTVKIFMSVE